MDRATVINCNGELLLQNCNWESQFQEGFYNFDPGETYIWNYKFLDDYDKGHQTNIYYNVIRARNYYNSNFSHAQPFIYAYSHNERTSSGQGTYIKINQDKERSSDIIIHEYTHAVTYNKKGGNFYDYCSHPGLPEFGLLGCQAGQFTWAALEEGIARYFPLSLNHNSVYGEGFSRSDYVCRPQPPNLGLPPIEIDIANDAITQAVDCNGDGLYADLEPNQWAFAGALWDIRDSFISEYGYTQGVYNADVLVWEALKNLRTDLGEFTPRDFYDRLLEADDILYGNTDPTDGTPHSFEIWQAFNNRLTDKIDMVEV